MYKLLYKNESQEKVFINCQFIYLDLTISFISLHFADNGQNLRPVPEDGHRVQDAEHFLPDDLQRSCANAVEQMQDEAQRPEPLLLDNGSLDQAKQR